MFLALLRAVWASVRVLSLVEASFAASSAALAIPRGSVAVGLFRAARAEVNRALAATTEEFELIPALAVLYASRAALIFTSASLAACAY